MTDTVGQIAQLSTNPENAAIRGAGFLPAGTVQEVAASTKWRMKGLLIATGLWIPIENYANEDMAKTALHAVRYRATFSDKVHIRDHEAFAVFAIENVTNIQYLGGVLRG